jgi:hypothetical protein
MSKKQALVRLHLLGSILTNIANVVLARSYANWHFNFAKRNRLASQFTMLDCIFTMSRCPKSMTINSLNQYHGRKSFR